jgi:hypothetical protein
VAQARFLILPRPFIDKPSWSKIAGELYARKPVRRGLISANSFPRRTLPIVGHSSVCFASALNVARIVRASSA